MNLIQNNPYRILGLLVGATAREQDRQLRRLKQFIEAEQEPDEDFSFPSLGKLYRTLEKVNDAASQLNLDSDKMNAALFWFYNGNSITDEPDFDAIKDADLDQVINIWNKQISNGFVNQRNASAFNNLGTIYLSGILDGTNSNVSLFEKGISLKLKFLDSIFIKEFKAIATDETFKITNTQIQLLFLNLVQTEIEKSKKITSNQFLEIITKQEFSAKEDFLKDFVQKPIEQIERIIEKNKKDLINSPDKAEDFANDLFALGIPLINTISKAIGVTNIKTISISDKLANQILQCSIILFNHFHETENEVGEVSLAINKKAELIARGNIVKGRIIESNTIVESYILDKPNRDKIRQIQKDIEFITFKLDLFNNEVLSVVNARDLIKICKPILIRIKNKLGFYDDLYLNLSGAVIQNAQNMLIQAVNVKIEEFTNNSNSSKLKETIEIALDTTFNIGTFDMKAEIKNQYEVNLNGLKSIARQLGISVLSPKEKVLSDLKSAEKKLADIKNTVYLSSQINFKQNQLIKLNSSKIDYSSNVKKQEERLVEIKKWQFLRSQATRVQEIKKQENIIHNLKMAEKKERENIYFKLKIELEQLQNDSEHQKTINLMKQKKIIVELENKLKITDY